MQATVTQNTLGVGLGFSGGWFWVDVMVVALDATLILVEALRDMGVHPGARKSSEACKKPCSIVKEPLKCPSAVRSLCQFRKLPL